MTVIRFCIITLSLLAQLTCHTDVLGQSPEPPLPYTKTVDFREDASLYAIAFRDRNRGLAVGDHGTILATDNGGLSWQIRSTPVQCRLDDIAWWNDRRVVAVGGGYDRITGISRGVVLISDDGGVRWRRAADQELPRLRALQIDRERETLVAEGDWSPASLSRKFESRDGGQTWNAANHQSQTTLAREQSTTENMLAWVRATGQHVPVRSAIRIDEDHLWALGDHGVILHSQDDGQTWRVSRGSDRHCAVLLIAASPRTVAWSLVGKESLEMRNRVSVLMIDPSASGAQGEPQTWAVTRCAAAMLGISGVDFVATSQEKPTLRTAAWISIHQPAVVVIDESLPSATRDVMIDDAIDLGVTRVLEYTFVDNASSSGNSASGDSLLHRSALLADNGLLASDLWEDVMHHVAPDSSPGGSVLLHRRYNKAGSRGSGESVVAGLAVTPQQKRSATSKPATRRQLQILRARMSEAKRVDLLIDQSPSVEAFAKGLTSLLDQSAESDRLRLAWSVLRSTRRVEGSRSIQGILFYQATLNELAKRFGNLASTCNTVGPWARLQHSATVNSLEWKPLRDAMRHAWMSQPIQQASTAESVAVSPFQQRNQVVQASATTPLLVPDVTPIQVTPARNESARVDLAWEFHPAVLIARDAARLRGDDQSPQSIENLGANLMRLAASTDRSAWSQLIRRQGPNVLRAPIAETRPRLDGLPEDQCWRNASPVSIDSTSIRIAYDEQYVYLMIRCSGDDLRHDDAVAANDSSRQRDHDLSRVDRLQIRLDTDRDLLTSMQMEVTDAGRTRDSIDGHIQWQPTWYVATQRSDGHVNLELAILRRDLVDLPIPAGESWFVSVRPVPAGTETPWRPIPDAERWRRVLFD